jgi:iron(III) transport system substrate-binding protein
MPRSSSSGWLVGLLTLTVALTLSYLLSRPDDNALVVYCAHDLVYAEPVLQEFERSTGIRVVIVSDTEATKSLGLTQQIIREGEAARRCDVFWNNQELGTVQVQEAGLLHPYKGPGYERIPERFKDPDGCWTGFGGRMRVWIVNTDKMEATESAIDTALAGDDLSQMAIAMPMFGTTLTHYALLWDTLGGDGLQEWHHNLVERGCRVLSGNATVKNLVAEGTCKFGMTDTDDFFVAKDNNKPVQQLPIRVNGATICIPNTVAIIKGTDNLVEAQQLADYLASAETELVLARSAARQIPLGPVDGSQLPEDVRPLAEWAKESSDTTRLGPARAECLEWLKAEYAP